MLNTFFYCIKQGFLNAWRNKAFTLAAITTVAACVFLSGFFYALFANITHIVHEAETTIGITVFFEEDADEEIKASIKEKISRQPGIRLIRYTSAEDAWARFQTEYFGDKAEELAAAFEDDNPLSGSDSFEVYPENIEQQQSIAEYIKGLEGVREVNYSSVLLSALKKSNRVISLLSVVIVGMLLAVSVFLIGNAIRTSAAFRKKEIRIMRLIGATDRLIRAPFVVEGLVSGFLGALLAVAGLYGVYSKAEAYVTASVGVSGMAQLFRLIPAKEIMPGILSGGLLMGAGMGIVVSGLSIRRYLKN